jgi:hypothetical protein
LRQAFDHAGGATVGADAKLVFALDLEEFRGLIEHRRDFCVLHRHDQYLLADRSLTRIELRQFDTDQNGPCSVRI